MNVLEFAHQQINQSQHQVSNQFTGEWVIRMEVKDGALPVGNFLTAQILTVLSLPIHGFTMFFEMLPNFGCYSSPCLTKKRKEKEN